MFYPWMFYGQPQKVQKQGMHWSILLTNASAIWWRQRMCQSCRLGIVCASWIRIILLLYYKIYNALYRIVAGNQPTYTLNPPKEWTTLVTFVVKVLIEISRWFRRRRAVGLDSIAPEAHFCTNCRWCRNHRRMFRNLHDKDDENVHHIRFKYILFSQRPN